MGNMQIFSKHIGDLKIVRKYFFHLFEDFVTKTICFRTQTHRLDDRGSDMHGLTQDKSQKLVLT